MHTGQKQYRDSISCFIVEAAAEAKIIQYDTYMHTCIPSRCCVRIHKKALAEESLEDLLSR